MLVFIRAAVLGTTGVVLEHAPDAARTGVFVRNENVLRPHMEFTGERFVPSLHGQIYYEHVHRYAIAARFSAGKRVLDIASGEGYGSSILARVAADVTGVDIDDAAVALARSVYYAANLRFLRGSALEIPLADASVDVAASFETIEHIGEPERMLDELSRVLVPGGLLIISSPNKRVYSDVPEYSNPFHVRELYFAELRDMLQRRFRNVALYGQRLVAASVVHPLAGAVSRSASWYSGHNGSERSTDDGLPTVPDPVYFFAICTNGKFDVDACSAFLDPGDDVLADISKELDTLRRHYALTVHGPGSQNGNGNGATALAAPAQTSLPAGDEAPVGLAAEDERLAAQVRETERVTAHYEDALAELEKRQALLADAEKRERAALAASEEARLREAEVTELFEAQTREMKSLEYNERAALDACNRARERAMEAGRLLAAQTQETERVAASYDEMVERVKASEAALAERAIRDEERSLELLRLTEELRMAAIVEEARDVAERRAISLQAALENTEESLYILQQTFERGRELAESQRAALSHYERSLEAAEATRFGLLAHIDELLEEKDRARGAAQQLQAARHILAQRTLQLGTALAVSDRLRASLEEGLADRDRALATLQAIVALGAPGDVDALGERTVQLAEALATAADVRRAANEGLVDRERSFDVMRALVSQAGLEAEAMLESRTLQLAESLDATARTRATMVDVLRIYREAFALLHARHVKDRRAAVPPPAFARRVVRRMVREAKSVLPEPLIRFGGSIRRRSRRT